MVRLHDSPSAHTRMRDDNNKARDSMEPEGEDHPRDEESHRDKNNTRAIWRQPTEEELHEILDFYQDEWGLTEETSLQYVNAGYYTILEGYQSDSPGYTGKILFCVHGFPEAFMVFVYSKGELTKINSINHDRDKR